jgi:hypothetical protein
MNRQLHNRDGWALQILLFSKNNLGEIIRDTETEQSLGIEDTV